VFIAPPEPTELRWIAPEKLHKIRVESKSMGTVTFTTCFTLCFCVMWMGSLLPIMTRTPLAEFVSITAVAANMCTLLAGACVQRGPAAVVTGYLDEYAARRLRRRVAALTIATGVLAAVSCGLLVLLTASRGLFGLMTVLFMLIPLLSVFLALTNNFVIRRLRPLPGPPPGGGPR
jgi:hypothetical protein